MGSPVNLIRSKENKNLLINGNFDFWQRGTTVSGASIYGADRWRGNSAMGSMQRRDRAFSAGLPLSAQYGCQFTSIVGGGGFGQRIEAARLVGMTGKYVTFSFRAGLVSGTTALSMNVGIPTVIDNYTSRTFVEAAVMGTPGAHGLSYQTFSRTFQISADMEARGMEINVFGDATVWSIIFSQMMLLEAPNGQTVFIPSEFAYAAESLAGESDLCQRYYQRGFQNAQGPAISASQCYCFYYLPVEMRAIPALSFISGVSLVNAIDETGTSPRTPSTLGNINTTTKCVGMLFGGMAGLTGFRPTRTNTDVVQADAEL